MRKSKGTINPILSPIKVLTLASFGILAYYSTTLVENGREAVDNLTNFTFSIYSISVRTTLFQAFVNSISRALLDPLGRPLGLPNIVQGKNSVRGAFANIGELHR